MTPQDVRDRLAALRRAGSQLRRRPAVEIHDALARVLDEWSDPGSRWQQSLVRELPKATGFAPETVRAGLALALADWNGDALRGLARSELQQADARGFDVTAVLLAGSIPMPSLLALIAPLAVRSPVLAKTASRDPVTAPLVAQSLAEVDPLLGACCGVVSLPGHDRAGMDALLEADCVVATGSDETLAEIARRVTPTQRLVGAGHRLSLAVLGERATRDDPLRQACAGLAQDIAFWDQLGCLSPIAVYVLGDGAADRVAAALAAALEDAEARWPRGSVDAAAAADIARERDGAELRAAAGADVQVRTGEALAWTVVRESDARTRPAPLHRFVRIHPIRNASELLAAIDPLSRHLAGVAVAGFGAAEVEITRALRTAGASRVCAPGQLQAPPLDWRREGRGVLAPLLRGTLGT